MPPKDWVRASMQFRRQAGVPRKLPVANGSLLAVQHVTGLRSLVNLKVIAKDANADYRE